MEVTMDFSKALDNKDLLRAAYDLDNEMAEVCLEAGLNVNYRDDSGSAALHYLAEGAAVKAGDPITVKREGIALLDSLLSYRADLNIPDRQNITCLHIACANNLFWLVHQLLQHGADPTIKDGLTGETPVEMFYHSILGGRKYPDSSDLHSATSMCRPALVLNSPSPIMTSLHYAHVYRRIAERCDGKAKMKYSCLSRSCEQVSQDLLQSCSSFMEARHVIQADGIALLRCAVSDQHSRFLQASFLQRHVEELWYGEAFRNAGTFSHWVIPVIFLLSPLLLPLTALAYGIVYSLFRWVYQDAALQDLKRKLKYYIIFLGEHCRYSPYIRFITNLCVYIVLAALLAAKCTYPFSLEVRWTAVDGFVALFWVGFAIFEVKQLHVSTNVGTYVHSSWHDVIYLALLLLHYGLQVGLLTAEVTATTYLDDPGVSATVNWYVPVISHILLALGTIMVFIRLLGYLDVTATFGPLEYSLWTVAKDVGYLIAVYVFVSVAFASGMTKVHNTGAGGGKLTSLNALWINNSTSTDELTGISAMFLNLQWAVFGLQRHDIFLSSYLPTHILSKVLLAVFLLTNLVVVSLLIVRLVSSVTTTQKEKTLLQRTHARARFILEYQDITDLPVPFNILYFVWLGLKALVLRCKQSCPRVPRVTCTCNATICRRWCKKRKAEKTKKAWSSYFGEGNVFQTDKADVSAVMRQMVANYQRTLQSHVSVEDVGIAVDTHLLAVEEETKGLKKEVEDVFAGLRSNKAALETNLETLQAQIT
ncbi:short transient receptor potential channel 5-like [Branchiostoma lanceolatum]|uniref:short transient receptor potential channel 5-like n=1 Tax=Branchiostoma lanceolatum TaxID=7740 RepID=UPI0034533C53